MKLHSFFRIEPWTPKGLWKDDRHSINHPCNNDIGGSTDNREVFGVRAFFPQAGKTHQPIIFEVKVPGLTVFAHVLGIKNAMRKNEASSLFEGFTEQGQLGNRFPSRNTLKTRPVLGAPLCSKVATSTERKLMARADTMTDNLSLGEAERVAGILWRHYEFGRYIE